MNDALYFTPLRIQTQRRRIIGTQQLDRVTISILDHLITTDDIGTTQAHFGAHSQTLVLRRRNLFKIARIDE